MFDYLMTEKEQLLLKFNDKHVVDSNSSNMGSALASSSEEDLLKKLRNAYVPGRDTTTLRQRISNKLKKNRKSNQCSLIKSLESKLEKNVGRYRHDKRT